MHAEAKTDELTLNVQRAEEDQETVDERGFITYEDFVEEFRSFQWVEQLKTANERKEVSPTVSAVDTKNNRTLWISVIGEEGNVEFLIGYRYWDRKATFFGFGPEKDVEQQNMYKVNDKAIIEDAIRCFFCRQYEELNDVLGELPNYP